MVKYVFVITCAVYLGCGHRLQHDVKGSQMINLFQRSSKFPQRAKLASFSQLLLLLHPGIPLRSSHLSVSQPDNGLRRSRRSFEHGRIGHRFPLMLGRDDGEGFLNGAKGFFGGAMRDLGKAIEKTGELVSKAGEKLDDDRNTVEEGRTRPYQPGEVENARPGPYQRSGQLQRKERGSTEMDRVIDDAFGGGLFGGLAKTMARGVTAGMAQYAAMTERIQDALLDAIRDDARAKQELGYNPQIGSPMQQSTSSMNINGVSTTKSSLVLPVQAEGGSRWTAQVEAEVSNNDRLILQRVVLRSQSGATLYLQDRASSGRGRGGDDGFIDVDVW